MLSLKSSVLLFAALASMPPAALLGQAPSDSSLPRQRAGRYEVTLHPPAGGLRAGAEMEIEFQVLDFGSADAASAGPSPALFARLRCAVDMPSMPSMPPFDEIAHREGVPGVYGVHPTFPHGGDYRLCITLLPPVEQMAMTPKPDGPFTVEFPLAVADASSGRRSFSEVRPYRLEVLARPSPPVSGGETELELRVRLENSPDLREVTDFDLVHERPMHLFLVRRDLGYFAHEHPELVAPGVFRLRHRFLAPGDWRLFADVAPRDAGDQVLAAALTVRPGRAIRRPRLRCPTGPFCPPSRLAESAPTWRSPKEGFPRGGRSPSSRSSPMPGAGRSRIFSRGSGPSVICCSSTATRRPSPTRIPMSGSRAWAAAEGFPSSCGCRSPASIAAGSSSSARGAS